MSTIPYAEDAQAFDEHLAAATTPVLVDFTADWCGPCQMLAPILDQISSETEDFTILKVDADANKETAERFEVQGLPTMILFEDGEELMRLTGAIRKKDLLARIEPFI